jgi:hypothetical protein
MAPSGPQHPVGQTFSQAPCSIQHSKGLYYCSLKPHFYSLSLFLEKPLLSARVVGHHCIRLKPNPITGGTFLCHKKLLGGEEANKMWPTLAAFWQPVPCRENYSLSQLLSSDCFHLSHWGNFWVRTVRHARIVKEKGGLFGGNRSAFHLPGKVLSPVLETTTPLIGHGNL